MQHHAAPHKIFVFRDPRLRGSFARQLACLTFACLLLGCDGGPQLGQVGGTVLLDGQPLKGAVVIFQPTAGGLSSQAETDENGRYELIFAAGKPGAVIGIHRVAIETWRPHLVDSVERVPPRYNNETELKREVSAGRQRIDFDLESE